MLAENSAIYENNTSKTDSLLSTITFLLDGVDSSFNCNVLDIYEVIIELMNRVLLELLCTCYIILLF